MTLDVSIGRDVRDFRSTLGRIGRSAVTSDGPPLERFKVECHFVEQIGARPEGGGVEKTLYAQRI